MGPHRLSADTEGLSTAPSVETAPAPNDRRGSSSHCLRRASRSRRRCADIAGRNYGPPSGRALRPTMVRSRSVGINGPPSRAPGDRHPSGRCRPSKRTLGSDSPSRRAFPKRPSSVPRRLGEGCACPGTEHHRLLLHLLPTSARAYIMGAFFSICAASSRLQARKRTCDLAPVPPHGRDRTPRVRRIASSSSGPPRTQGSHSYAEDLRTRPSALGPSRSQSPRAACLRRREATLRGRSARLTVLGL